ncbi:MAG: hypothetical protein FWG38_10195, partial [Defluviitaleaceae bacterium]|nr:hypothetical protein [Defluviitaleaceae bacterium]
PDENNMSAVSDVRNEITATVRIYRHYDDPPTRMNRMTDVKGVTVEDYDFIAYPNGQYGFPNAGVRSLSMDKAGGLWAGTYGGGLAIAPAAKFDDGKITLCMVNGMSRLKLGVLFPSLLIKKHVLLKDITFEECTELRVKLPNGAETLCLDGNLYPVEGEIHFKILPQVLDVFA